MATTRIPDSALLEGGRGALLARHGSGRPDDGTVLTRARGSLVWDFEGRECIDCTSQAQSKNLGANDPRVMDGAIKQLREIAPIRPVCSSLALSEVSAKLGAIASAGLGQVAYSLHGSKAVDRTEVRPAQPTRSRECPRAPGRLSRPQPRNDGGQLAASAQPVRAQQPHFTPVPTPNPYRPHIGLDPYTDAQLYLELLRDTIRKGVDGAAAAVLTEPAPGPGGHRDGAPGRLKQLCQPWVRRHVIREEEYEIT
jgi:4-aminobutyrate aminotransferase / (S)-3-amino-2-methylpropionate transaminase / 5-aminovalerate transaminase